jgi:hypothetical protein
LAATAEVRHPITAPGDNRAAGIDKTNSPFKSDEIRSEQAIADIVQQAEEMISTKVLS